jgi:hypothetical protein
MADQKTTGQRKHFHIRVYRVLVAASVVLTSLALLGYGLALLIGADPTAEPISRIGTSITLAANWAAAIGSSIFFWRFVVKEED